MRDRYMRRWRVVRTRQFRIDLIKMIEPDPRDERHSHARNSWDLVLRGGGYAEYRGQTDSTRYAVRRWHRRDYYELHRIIGVFDGPTWILRFSGRNRWKRER